MKKHTFKKLLLALLLWAGTFTGSFAKTIIPPQNYWVVETTLKQRDYSVVRFYNRKNELLYEERLHGIYVNISRAKHVKRLNLALHQVTGKSFNTANPKNVIASLYHR